MMNLKDELLIKLSSILGKTIFIEGYGSYQVPETNIYLSHEFNGYLKVSSFNVSTIFNIYSNWGELEIPVVSATYENLVAYDTQQLFISWFDSWVEQGLIEKGAAE